MSVIEKARELGQEIRGCDEFKEVEQAGRNVNENVEASQVIKEMQDVQQQLEFSRNSGVEPSEDQINKFNEVRDKMNDNLIIKSYMKAQETFSKLMQDINSAISEGIDNK